MTCVIGLNECNLRGTDRNTQCFVRLSHMLVAIPILPLEAAQHSTAQHSTAQHSTAQHSTAQHSTAQHSTAQHSPAQPTKDVLVWPQACVAGLVIDRQGALMSTFQLIALEHLRDGHVYD